MKRKKLRTAAVSMLMTAALLSGCGAQAGESADAVSVQPVSELATVNISGNNQYSGIVEASSTQKVKKSSKKTVEECFVEEGDQVKKGDRLFKYDTRSAELEVQSAELEIEQLEGNIKSYNEQINELNKEREKASANKKLSYSLEIQEAEIDRSEAEYNLKKKQQELEKLRESSKKTTVRAKISGVVQSINDDDNNSDDSNNDAYITILQTDSYRVKGTVSETNVRSLAEDQPVQVISRLDENETWSGTISKIDTDSSANSSNEDEEDDYGSSGEKSTKYDFYVKLDDSEGLLMGQHVLISTGDETQNEEEQDALYLPASFLAEDEDGNFFVWIGNSRDKLDKKQVTVGEYNEYDDTYPILDGLSEEDYIAFPSDDLKEGMDVTKYDEIIPEGNEEGMEPEGDAGDYPEDIPEDVPDYEEGGTDDGTIGGADDGMAVG